MIILPTQYNEREKVGERDADVEAQQHTADPGPRRELSARRSVEDAAAKIQGGKRLPQIEG